MGSVEESSSPMIPLIDFFPWTTSQSDVSQEERLETARKLVVACHNHGFVYIKNHGISRELLAEAFDITKSFFEMPSEKKMLTANPGLGSFRGYSKPGLEKVGAISDEGAKVPGSETEVVDFNESYGLGSDLNPVIENVWPSRDLLPKFQPVSTKFYWECWRASELILRALALGLGLPDEDFLLRFHTGHENEISLRHYPPVKASAVEKQEMRRLSSHTDFDSFTLLFQDDCGGLEIEKKGSPGEYVPVDPVEGAVVMNIGDALMRWTNDYLISTKHRVHLPPLEDRYTGDERMTRERFSVPYFVSPKMETMLECLPNCTSTENPPRYEPVSYEAWYRHQAEAVFG